MAACYLSLVEPWRFLWSYRVVLFPVDIEISMSSFLWSAGSDVGLVLEGGPVVAAGCSNSITPWDAWRLFQKIECAIHSAAEYFLSEMLLGYPHYFVLKG